MKKCVGEGKGVGKGMDMVEGVEVDVARKTEKWPFISFIFMELWWLCIAFWTVFVIELYCNKFLPDVKKTNDFGGFKLS